MSDSMHVHNIVILGASYAGNGTAHGLLKAIPTLQSQTEKQYKVTLIADSEYFWWSVGAPRAMLKPYPTSIDDSFLPVKESFAKYPPDRFEFVYAQITGLDTTKREVSYKLKQNEETAEATSNLHFDTLIIATGSTGASPLYALQGGHQPTYNAYKDVHSRLPEAKTVMVVGGGSAGVETAGELGFLHGANTDSPKDITILSGSSRVLSHLRPAISTRAEETLSAMGVKIVNDVRLQDSKKLAGGGEEITLTDGSTQHVDVLLVATGRVPASSFLPRDLVNEKGKVIVDDYLRLPSLDSAYSLGDVASVSPGGLFAMFNMVPTGVANVVAELGGKGKGKEWKMFTDKETQIVPIGPNGGVGAMFGWWAPSFLVRLLKARDFMFGRAPKYLNGEV